MGEDLGIELRSILTSDLGTRPEVIDVLTNRQDVMLWK